MTKERRLAIRMWEEVKEQLHEWYKEHPYDIVHFLCYFKSDFCRQNELTWLNDCWFCQYICACDKCPLRSCDYHNFATAWVRIVGGWTSLETKLQACDEIITALKGGIRCGA